MIIHSSRRSLRSAEDLAVDLEVARRGEQWGEVRERAFEGDRVDQPIAAPGVPGGEELRHPQAAGQRRGGSTFRS